MGRGIGIVVGGVFLPLKKIAKKDQQEFGTQWTRRENMGTIVALGERGGWVDPERRKRRVVGVPGTGGPETRDGRMARDERALDKGNRTMQMGYDMLLTEKTTTEVSADAAVCCETDFSDSSSTTALLDANSTTEKDAGWLTFPDIVCEEDDDDDYDDDDNVFDDEDEVEDDEEFEDDEFLDDEDELDDEEGEEEEDDLEEEEL